MNLQTVQEFLRGSFLVEVLPLSPMALVIFSIQSTLFLLLVWGADRLLKRGAASSRKFLWFWALMTLPLLTTVANITPATRADLFLATAFELQLPEQAASNGQVPGAASGEAVIGSEPATTPDREALEPASQFGRGFALLAGVKNWDWLVFSYFLIALPLLARLPLGWMQLARLRRTAVETTDERLVGLYTVVARQLGYAGTCQLRITTLLESPVSFGIRVPTILLPAEYLEQLTDMEIRSILLHELSHIRNKDPMRIVLSKLIESLFFFQPLVWLASSRVFYLSELVADDSVLETGVAANNYANSIVNLIELGSEPNHQYGLSTGIFSSPKMLVSRMEYLLDDSCRHSAGLAGRNLFASSLGLLMAILLTLQFVPRSSALGAVAAAPQDIARSNQAAGPQDSPALAANSQQVEYFLSVDRFEVALGEAVTLTIGAEPAENLYQQITELMRRIEDFDADMQRISFDGTRSNNGTARPWAEIVIALLPRQEGSLTIPSFTIGNQQTQAIEIEVSSETNERQAQTNEDLYLNLELSTESFVVNEPFELSIQLFYTINGIREPQFTELLVPNSVIQSIEAPRQYEERIDGVRYGVYEKRYVLTPQEAGQLEIPDITFRGIVIEGDSSPREVSAFIEGMTIEVAATPEVGP